MAGDLDSTLAQFEMQLATVCSALEITPPGHEHDELLQLRDQLEEAIALTTETISKTPNTSKQLDDEFSKFKAEMEMIGVYSNEDNENVSAHPSSPLPSNDDEKEGLKGHIMNKEEEKEEEMEDLEEYFSQLVGTKCQAPFSHSWGKKSYHNAIITEADASSYQVRVLFITPSCTMMKPCHYYLNGSCNFGERCKYSHGHLVDFDSIREYVAPDFMKVKLGARCLAKYSEDDLWYPSTVVDLLDDNKVVVKFDEDKDDTSHTVELADIFPLDESNSKSEDEDMEEWAQQNVQRVNGQLQTGWVPQDATRRSMGQWEQFTKGIGSSLMAKMGYVWGQGLGKDGEGRLEPIDAVILPAGKSLDRCMEIREQSETGQHETIESRSKAAQIRRIKKLASAEKAEPPLRKNNTTNVFDFLNQRLSKGPSKVSGSEKLPKEGKKLNIQSLQVSESVRKAEGELRHLHASLARNQDRDKVAAARIRAKITAQEKHLHQLRQREREIEQRQQTQKEHKKLSIF